MPLVKRQERTDRPAKRRPTAAQIDVSLPTQANTPPSKLSDYSVMIYGAKGIGKSSLAAQFPDNLTFMFEPGRRNLPIKQIPDPLKKEEPLTWARLKAYRDLVVEEPKIKTVTMDSVDRAYDLCLKHVCLNRGISDPGDVEDFGKTWRAIKDEFEAVMNSFREAGKSLIYLSHERLREVRNPAGDPYDLVTPTCPDAPWGYLKASCDFALYYGYYTPAQLNQRGKKINTRGNSERVITIRGNEMIWSACGVEGRFFSPGKSGVPLAMIPMGSSSKEAYHNLLGAFDNKLEVPDYCLLDTKYLSDEAGEQAVR